MPIFSITRRRLNDEKGFVEVEIRQRGSILRSAKVAPDTVDPNYSDASEEDRQYAYLTPGSQTFFDNGDPAYTVVP